MYCINPQDDEPIFCLFEPIGADEANPMRPYVDGNQFAKELLYMDGEGKKRIQIWINCEGGNIKDGLSICSAILQTKTKVDTLTIGIAYSMGGVIASMGRKREAMDFASFMCHMGYNADGSQDAGLDAINKSLITALASRMSKTEDEVRKILKATTYYTAAEAKAAGLIDEIVDCGTTNKPRQIKTAAEAKSFALAYLNKAITQETTENTMNKAEICALLGLDPSVTDAFAMDALKTHLAKAKSMPVAEQSPEMKAALKRAEDAEKALAEKEAKEKADAKAKEDADAATAKAEAIANAKTAIEAKAKERNLKFEDKVIVNYVDMAGTTKEGLAKVIETIEAIPVTIKAPVLKSVNEKAADAIGIALIEAGHEEKLSPIALAAGDTSKMVASINSFDFHRDWVHRKR